ncbi:MAG: hypothetical protein H0X24_00805 [Ktedonobacterales bacterium]|nr:hypothetical protein [Ktedonobacterales bacterium]
MTTVLISEKHQQHQVRAEMRSEARLREALPDLPPIVAIPLARLVAYMTQIRQVQETLAPGSLGALYLCAYPAYQEARSLAEQRLQWLSEYGVALLPRLRATTPTSQVLAQRLARVAQMVDASLTAMVTAQCVLDEAIAQAEDQVAA